MQRRCPVGQRTVGIGSGVEEHPGNVQIPASARHQQRRLARIVRRIELRLRGREQCTHDLGLIVVDRLVQQRVAFGITAVRRVGSVLAQPYHDFRQPVCRGVVQRAVSRLVRSLGIGTAVDQPQSGIRAAVLYKPHQWRAALIVRGIGIGPGIDEFGQNLAVALPGGGVEGRFAPIVCGRGVGSLFQQQHDQIAVSLAADVMERRVALGIAPVEIDVAPFEENLHDVFLSVAAGVQKGLESIHSVDFRRISAKTLQATRCCCA